ncbi:MULTISPECIES: DUF3304 domain-containing protein [Burkholderia]|uniref:DUF3304 domain-containing protein n=1 Tax=Burkholderia TaxID=32008 RepID=UPI0005317747|nr:MULTISPECIES: DUF3304 domain-containing protein [Burkholderia]AOJ69124.1 hypothetical protein WS78_10430 [Burkholderia savannae]KGR97580.1 hypothetical protein X946_1314 [Burkholderia sp. ABCPW 111]KVG39435.1 hypothetical protein WS77_19690 [Burkholderia sp. MSMB0265]KVG80366.1 hypothetical protein WS81_13625 [Burkholderia sp. MSMB2040]KVG93261.1 hypothetical protein WS83_01140 [Burkholderia sp. MSMB2042]
MNLHFGPMKVFIRLTIFLIVFLAGAGCSRATDRTSVDEGEEALSQSGGDAMSLKLNALNYTDIPIGTFYVDGTWGSTVASRIGSGGGRVICCVSLPTKWRPGLTVTVQWQDDNLYKKATNAMASRVIPVEKYDYFSDGFLWVLFFPNDKIKVYASQWMPGFPGFPEGLQAPNEACPGHFTLRNDDPRCSHPDKRIKS